MKLRALHLLAYGAFRDRTLRFENDGGIELVYGPNEAGKSTTRRAVLALLFGVPTRSKDGHSLSTGDELRVGATIEDAHGRVTEIVRRKGAKNTLLDGEGSPIDEAILTGLLGGIGASAYEMAYGLDHETLRKGGAALRVGNGELGETLFSAATGLTGLHGVLVELRAEADALFVPSGTKRPLNEALRSFSSAKKMSAQLATSASKWLEVEKQIELARAELVALRGERATAAEERAIARRTAEMARTIETQRARSAELASTLASSRAEMEALAPSSDLLSRTQAIATLQERLGSHRKAQADRPRVLAELEVVEERARRAKRDAPNAVTAKANELPAEAHVRKLSLEGASLRERARAAEAREADANGAMVVEQEKVDGLTNVSDAHELREALERTQREGDLTARLTIARDEARRARSAAEGHLRMLEGIDPSITIETIASLPVPSLEVIASHARAAVDLAARTRSTNEKRRRLEEDLADVERTIATLRAQGDVPTDDALARARSDRDAQWDELRDAPKLSQAAATRFERAMRIADDLSDRLRREAARVTRSLELEATRESTVKKLEIARDEESTLADEAARAKLAWESNWVASKIVARAPDEMSAWRSRFDAALSLARRATETHEHTLPLEAAESASRALLKSALAHLGVDAPDESLMLLENRAKRTLVERDAVRKTRESAMLALENAKRERDRASRDRTTVDRDRAEWNARWSTATRTLGLDTNASPEEVTSALDAATALTRIEDEAEKLRRRLAGIDRDAKQFAEDVRAICAACATDLVSIAPEESSAELARRVARATEQRARRDALEDQVKRLDAQARETSEMQPVEDESVPHSLRGEIAEARAATLDARISDLDERIERAQHNLGGIETGAKQFDQSPAIEQAAEAQRHLARARDLAERHVRARLAAAAVARLLERYRKENQGPVLARASSLFATLTLGVFSGLEVGFGESDEPVLMAVRDSRRLETSALSDGTLDQLYLALRVASLERLAASRGPLPLLLDDVLVHFDDQRAAAALAVLSALATSTQVILFTHHERIVELAKRNISDRDGTAAASVHDLGMLRAR